MDGKKRTDRSLDIKEPRGRPSHQVRWLRRKHCSSCGCLETSPTNTCHTCLPADLGIGLWNLWKPRLFCYHQRWHILERRCKAISPRPGVVLRGRNAMDFRPRVLKVGSIYRRWSGGWDSVWLIIRGVGSGIIRRCCRPGYIVRWSTGAGAASGVS